jgi:four helix bundle protein
MNKLLEKEKKTPLIVSRNTGVFKDAAYRKLVVWQNLYELRRATYKMTKSFPKDEYRRISQMRDAARSAKQNLQEGHRRKSRKEYLRFLDFAHASLHELAGDIEDSFDDGLLDEDQFENLASLINRTDYLFRRLIDSLDGIQKQNPLSRSSSPVNSLSRPSSL